MITLATIYNEMQAMRREVARLSAKVQPSVERTWISHDEALMLLGKSHDSRYMERVITSGVVRFKGRGKAAKYWRKDIEAMHEGRINIYKKKAS